MKYCTNCGSEYQAAVERCADCGEPELVSAEEMHRRGLPIAVEKDTRRFLRAGTAEDPLTAEQFTDVLREAHIPVFSRQRLGGTVEKITGGSMPYWEILVPEDFLDRAIELLDMERNQLDSTSEEAARAAEEEEAESEQAGAKPA